MSAKESSVDLGFVEEQEPWLLTNKFFPSKVGGRPAWLELSNLPAIDRLKCGECEQELTFLCQVSSTKQDIAWSTLWTDPYAFQIQVYAPLDEFDYCFHRTLYVFVCTNGPCWKPNTAKNIRILRNQLPRVNQYYDFDQASEDTETVSILPFNA